MDDWNRDHHGRSGLLDRVRASTQSVSDAESTTLRFLAISSRPAPRPCAETASVRTDAFSRSGCRSWRAYCHYRNLDVSTLKILAQRWAPDVASAFKKESRHLALDDIRESIDELKHYRTHLFLAPGAVCVMCCFGRALR
jgi:oligoribonuclease